MEVQILKAREAAKLAGVHYRTILKELSSGRLRGRNIGGGTGFITTSRAVCEWAEGLNGQGGVAAKPALEPETGLNGQDVEIDDDYQPDHADLHEWVNPDEDEDDPPGILTNSSVAR